MGHHIKSPRICSKTSTRGLGDLLAGILVSISWSWNRAGTENKPNRKRPDNGSRNGPISRYVLFGLLKVVFGWEEYHYAGGLDTQITLSITYTVHRILTSSNIEPTFAVTRHTGVFSSIMVVFRATTPGLSTYKTSYFFILIPLHTKTYTTAKKGIKNICKLQRTELVSRNGGYMVYTQLNMYRLHNYERGGNYVDAKMLIKSNLLLIIYFHQIVHWLNLYLATPTKLLT